MHRGMYRHTAPTSLSRIFMHLVPVTASRLMQVPLGPSAVEVSRVLQPRTGLTNTLSPLRVTLCLIVSIKKARVSSSLLPTPRMHTTRERHRADGNQHLKNLLKRLLWRSTLFNRNKPCNRTIRRPCYHMLISKLTPLITLHLPTKIILNPAILESRRQWSVVFNFFGLGINDDAG